MFPQSDRNLTVATVNVTKNLIIICRFEEVERLRHKNVNGNSGVEKIVQYPF